MNGNEPSVESPLATYTPIDRRIHMLAPESPAPTPPVHLQAITLSRGTRLALPATGARGVGRFFVTENFQFQTLRALTEIASGSADLNEVLETVKTIVDGDVQSWYQGWAALADRTLTLAERTRDPLSKGNAYLRAHNYLRVAAFLLPPYDPKRPTTWRTSLARFDRALEVLGVRCERINVPYLAGKLRAHYFPGRPGAERKPLIMLVGGYDSTLEELYPMLGRAALERGYSVLAYEGPGQGQALRDGFKFTPDWENPNGAVLDTFLGAHNLPQRIVLVGMGMGGYFAPRAAAYDKRIDGVVAWDTCFDFGRDGRSIPRPGPRPGPVEVTGLRLVLQPRPLDAGHEQQRGNRARLCRLHAGSGGRSHYAAGADHGGRRRLRHPAAPDRRIRERADQRQARDHAHL